ncbi:MetQ/NlpA family ABC transporter substrate-binding protein [Anaerotignum lactatifermentans]|uniref:Lipoprotein n=1 Tax=Anaerotignum lactatifermentans TaxID=160404 RepID=A0ABS2GC54_9FIRM|nr:MetQ/NlpA family ABC transporter substrate-binding protein [Anaerotignum lactatifermentans]MBM6829871.1 MetQ/NlpA family ABC transporter substrate-binding protein [Anaerotignum lactatifermentans]MBM6878373.1 MetQ/NlpA family ABC transporter substrate-binding protein [Anaerotignum lactatifermentans]MBM6951528.1 MetQ/NlpA family ABC transporter substrate-binding protein [Anaerotignum lactatifermentans]
MKKFFGILLAATLAFGAVGCGSTTTDEDTNGTETTAEGTTIKVGASPSPHAEILYAAQPLLAEQGITLEVVEFNDYVQPNLALDTGDLDANYFQHQPYLDQFNADNGTDLIALGAVHYEPMAIFAGTSSDLAALPDGAKVGVPNDGTNEARALLLLEANGLITLKEGTGVSATKLDIEENPHNLEIVEMEAAQLPLSLGSLDIAVINGNYAMSNGLSIADALAKEEADSLAAETYENIVAVRNGDETRPELVALMEVLNSQDIADFINNTFEGAVAPVFTVAE